MGVKGGSDRGDEAPDAVRGQAIHDYPVGKRAQPRDLAFCQLPGGGDGLGAHLGAMDGALQIAPNLAVADAAYRGKLWTQVAARTQAPHFVDQSRLQHGVEALLDARVQIVEYRKSFLHAKVAVIDGRWATVGSSNIDPFSLLLAREANIVVDDETFARELRDSLIEHMREGAAPVEREHWHKQPLMTRVRIWIAYGIARFLIGWFGYGGKH